MQHFSWMNQLQLNDMIVVQIHFFEVSILWGTFMLIFYDFFRILRRVVNHNSFFVAMEDLIYWVICALLIFQMMYQQNNGIIRGFAILAILIGMILYHWLISDFLVGFVAGVLVAIKMQFKKIVSILLKPLKKIYDSCKMKVHKIRKNLEIKRNERLR